MRLVAISLAVLLAAPGLRAEPEGAGADYRIPMIAAGIGFTLAGLQDRERAARPSVTINGTVGSRKFVQISRSW